METISRKDAIYQGLKEFFTGKPCVRGHITNRFTSTKHCVECNRLRCKRRYDDGKTILSAQRQQKQKIIFNNLSETQRSKIISRTDARNKGLLTYFNGNPCKFGHITERQVSNGNCISCIKLRDEEWRQSNRDKSCSKTAKYRTRKLEATPEWLTSEHHNQILQFYTEAMLLTNTTGIKHHVDHIVPVQGKHVCGLHVPWNLQILTGKQNHHKSNKFNS